MSVCKIDIEKLKLLASQGKTREEIAELFDSPIATIRGWFWRLGIDTATQWATIDLGDIKQLIFDGKTTHQISHAHNMGYRRCKRILKENNIVNPNDWGIYSHMPSGEVDNVRKLIEQGFLQKEIAKIYGVGQQYVSKYMRRNDIPANNGRGRTR